MGHKPEPKSQSVSWVWIPAIHDSIQDGARRHPQPALQLRTCDMYDSYCLPGLVEEVVRQRIESPRAF